MVINPSATSFRGHEIVFKNFFSRQGCFAVRRESSQMPMHDPQLWRMEKVLPLLYFSPSLSLSVETISSGGVDCGTLNAANRLLIAAFLHLSPEPWDGVEEVEPRNCCRPLPSQLAVNPANRRIFLRSKLAPLPPRRLKPLYEFLCEPRPPSGNAT